jgi:hypothetical protein
MYDLYPEWGPARHRHETDEPLGGATRRHRYWEPSRDVRVPAMAGGPEARDADGDRPDDN